MKLLYADTLFAMSLATDYLLCVAAARLCAGRIRRGRCLLAALFGAAYAVAVFLPGLSFLATPALELCAAGFMGLIAFGGEERLWRCLAAFLALSAAFGGMVWAVAMRAGSAPGLPLLLAVFLLCYGALTLFSRTRRRRAETGTAEALLTLGGRQARFRALLDSGNCLSDPVTGARVLIASPAALAPLLGDAALSEEADPVELLRRASRDPKLAGRLRLLPCSGVGGKALLAALRPDSAVVDGKERPGLLAAISPSAAGEGFEGVY